MVLMQTIIILAVLGAYFVSSLTTTQIESVSSSISYYTTSSSSLTRSRTVTVPSCSPGPCLSPSGNESFTTVNGTQFVVINGTTTEEVICTVMAEGNLILTVLNSSNNKPIDGIPVGTTEVAPECQNSYSTINLTKMFTNASGIVTLCCDVGNYNFTITYLGATYSANATIEPERATCVVIDIPSGRVNVTYSQTFVSTC